ncbi:MAG: deoxycytidylate deaminase [Thermoplasmatota archaeon]
MELIEARPSWEEYFMDMARLAAKRATCHRRAVGAVLVRDRHVLATGYNGNPSGFEHCALIGCIREITKVPSGAHHELCTGLHAEQNAIIQAAVTGVSIAGATLYTTTFPCVTCAKMLMNARIVEIVYEDGYPDELGRWMLARSPIVVRQFGHDAAEALDGNPDLAGVEGVVATMASLPNPRA